MRKPREYGSNGPAILARDGLPRIASSLRTPEKAGSIKGAGLCQPPDRALRRSLRYVSWKERKAVAHDLRAIYTAPTAEAAEAALAEFGKEWDGRFPSISRSWREHWENMIPFFAHPPEIRKVIYTTNAVESINAAIRKVTKKRGAFG
jgi:hypothetical protein